jgi:probable rRNA maturation factor
MIEINNLSGYYKKINSSFIKKTIEKVLKAEGFSSKNIEISVGIVNSEEIKKINKAYRKKNKPTDVLSFGTIGEDLLEIIICPEEVQKNGKNFDEEFKKVIIHGTLHLLGYNHEKEEKEALKMFAKQENYLQD